jgi:hypothetical protein
MTLKLSSLHSNHNKIIKSLRKAIEKAIFKVKLLSGAF